MKFSPVKIELKPLMKIGDDRQHDMRVGKGIAVGRVERPSGVDPAEQDHAQGS